MSEETSNTESTEKSPATPESKPAPEPKPEPKPAKHKSAVKKRSAGKKSGHPVWVILLLIVLAAIAGAGWYGHGLYQATQQRVTAIQQSQTALVDQNQAFEKELLSRLSALQNQQRELTDYIEVIREKNQHLRKDWLLMEAEYLIQLANYRLLFERDINTAVAALESADVRLRDAGDPGLLGVRKVIAESVHSLKQVAQADLAGLSLTMSALNKDIEKLPLKTPDPKSKAHQIELEKSEASSKKVESWSELPAAMWNDVKKLIVIRDHQAPIQPLLSPEERFFLVENLRLQIEQARLAMLSGQVEVYKERLKTAIGWIDEHFDKEAVVTKTTLDALNKLIAEPIAPPLPDITATYRALQKYRQGNQPSKAVKPSKPAAEPKQETTTGEQPAGQAP